MNLYAYRTAGIAVKALTNLLKTHFRTHGDEKIPKGALIFAINHFTRVETIFIPYFINRLTGKTIWSLADYRLFKGGLGAALDQLGAVSTHNPDRDRLIVKSLLTNDASWIIFPEGRMVKSKKVFDEKGKKESAFMVVSPEGTHSPRTGTATLALRTEFYRQRLHRMLSVNPKEAVRLSELFGISDIESVFEHETYIVPVNVTYYPLRAKENHLNRLTELFIGDVSEKMAEEIMTEGSLLLSGADIDIRFGDPIRVAAYLKSEAIQQDIASERPIDFDDTIPSRSMLRKTSHHIMARYMSAIYQMTTINHDHIIATLLKYMSLEQIKETDLRSRVYLATTLDWKKMAAHRHGSLLQNQSNLLTDDRYDKVTNFLELAMQKKVLIRQNGWLKKTWDFSEQAVSQLIRIENPVAVVANEVEPLRDLQKELEEIASLPELRVKFLLRRYLLEKAQYKFDMDYANFAVPGESNSKEVGRPFMLRGRSRELGIVLVHGYMAAPLEVRALAEYLAKMGIWVYSPRLKGHGTSPEDLATRQYMEWVESVEDGYAIIRNICRRVVVGGFSFGAGLVLDLCTRTNDIEGVFAISPPFKLQDFSAHFVPAVNFWNRLMRKLNVESARKEFIENKPENPHINYFRNPLSGLMEMEHLMELLAQKIDQIDIPALVVQSLVDPVVHHGGAYKIFKNIGSAEKEFLMVNVERHGIINGDHSERIFAAVADFIGRLNGRIGLDTRKDADK